MDKNIITAFPKKFEKRVEVKGEDDGPIYYNLTLNKGFTSKDNTGFNTPANFSEINTQPILFNSGEWFVGLMRTTIPTGIIPRYIYPIQLVLIDPITGQPLIDPITKQIVLNDNINLTYNTFTFKYYDQNGNLFTLPDITTYQRTAIFESEVLNPYPQGVNAYFSLPLSPAQNNGQQDVGGSYYFVYNVITLLKLYNDTIKSLWVDFVKELNTQSGGTINLPEDAYPYYTYNEQSFFWNLNFRQNIFDQDVFPQVQMFSDDLTAENTFTPFYYNAQPSTAWDIALYKCFNTGDNLFTSVNSSGNTVNMLKMEADQSSIVGYSAFQKIVFEVSGDLSLINNEFDAIPLQFQGSTQSFYQKPYISMLTDLEVYKDSFSQNSTFIQFQASAIEQIRLLSLSKKSSVQNFNLSISWVDSYGNKRPLEIPNIGNPLTIKLAFFRKDFKKSIKN